jgi:hypothetical protein
MPTLRWADDTGAEAIRLDPTYTRAFLNRGRPYHAKGDDARSREEYDTALSLNPAEDMKQDIEDALKELAPPATNLNPLRLD